MITPAVVALVPAVRIPDLAPVASLQGLIGGHMAAVGRAWWIWQASCMVCWTVITQDDTGLDPIAEYGAAGPARTLAEAELMGAAGLRQALDRLSRGQALAERLDRIALLGGAPAAGGAG